MSSWKGIVWIPPVENPDGYGRIQDALQPMASSGWRLQDTVAIKAQPQALVSETMAECHVNCREQLAHHVGRRGRKVGTCHLCQKNKWRVYFTGYHFFQHFLNSWHYKRCNMMWELKTCWCESWSKMISCTKTYKLFWCEIVYTVELNNHVVLFTKRFNILKCYHKRHTVPVCAMTTAGIHQKCCHTLQEQLNDPLLQLFVGLAWYY